MNDIDLFIYLHAKYTLGIEWENAAACLVINQGPKSWQQRSLQRCRMTGCGNLSWPREVGGFFVASLVTALA